MYTSLSAPLFTIVRRADQSTSAPLSKHLLFALLCFRPSIFFIFFFNSNVAIIAWLLSSCMCTLVHYFAFLLLLCFFVFLTDANFFSHNTSSADLGSLWASGLSDASPHIRSLASLFSACAWTPVDLSKAAYSSAGKRSVALKGASGTQTGEGFLCQVWLTVRLTGAFWMQALVHKRKESYLYEAAVFHIKKLQCVTQIVY